MANQPKSSELTILADATCTACGCACDDIELTVLEQTIGANRIVQANRACIVGEDWFCTEHAQPDQCCTLDGNSADVDDGYARAADILAAAKYPIVFGLSDLACEVQRVAVSIADRIGGLVDSSNHADDAAACIAMQSVGEVTCTLGEVANRGDFVLFWGTDPAVGRPRHFAKYSLLPQGMHTPGGRKDRTCVVVDSKPTATAEEADTFLQIEPGKDFEALWTLRALAKGIELDPERVLCETGVALADWQTLFAQIKCAHYGVVFFCTGLTSAGHATCEALLSLVRDLNALTRFAAIPNRGRGNTAGAENLLAWQTGYPLGVSFNRGYPRYGPGEFTAADVLARGEADCALVLSGNALADLPPSARERVEQIPLVVLNPTDSQARSSATVAFATGISGIHTGGTMFRMDNVPLPLRPALTSALPSELEVLAEIQTRVQALLYAERTA